MLETVSIYLAGKTADPKKGNIEILAYGYELALSTLLTATLILSIAIGMGQISLGLLFIASYAPIRACAGGYHAKTFLGCNVASVISFVLLIALYRFGRSHFNNIGWQCIQIFSVLIILLNAPHENKNHPLSAEKRQKNRKRLVMRLSKEIFITQLLLLLGFTKAYIAILSLFLVAILLILSIIFVDNENENSFTAN